MNQNDIFERCTHKVGDYIPIITKSLPYITIPPKPRELSVDMKKITDIMCLCSKETNEIFYAYKLNNHKEYVTLKDEKKTDRYGITGYTIDSVIRYKWRAN